MDELNGLIEAAPDHHLFLGRGQGKAPGTLCQPWNPYEIAMHFCMERLHQMLTAQGQQGRLSM
jgi:hypothetical protein